MAVKISTILRKAANEHLPYRVRDEFSDTPSPFSCDAVNEASNGKDLEASQFLLSLGCFVGSCVQFAEFSVGPERQGARFFWLHFAALVAEDEGL
jgi:hypothetical protein